MIRFGLIGYGNIAKKFTKSIEFVQGGCVSAIASKSVKQDDSYLQAHPDVKVYRDYLSLLEDKDIDAVYIAIPHKYHLEWILEAMKHGKAILSEKPMVLTPEDVKKVIETAKEYPTYCLEALKTKFNIGFLALQKDLELIGDVTKIEANFCFDATGGRKDTYLFDPSQGGALNDVGTYLLAFVLGITKKAPTNITCEATLVNDIDMNFVATLTFDDNQQAIIEGAIDKNKERYATIEGTKGKIHVPYFNRVIDYVIELDNQKIERSYPINGDDMTMEIQAIVDDIAKGLHESEIHSLNDTLVIAQITDEIRKAMRK